MHYIIYYIIHFNFFYSILKSKTYIHPNINKLITENDFFDYDAKYNGKSKEQTPADIDEMLVNTIHALSSEIYDVMGLRSIARIDFILVGTTPYVIEVNTIPGFSEASIVPQMLNIAGIDLKDFWKMVIEQELNSLP